MLHPGDVTYSHDILTTDTQPTDPLQWLHTSASTGLVTLYMWRCCWKLFLAFQKNIFFLQYNRQCGVHNTLRSTHLQSFGYKASCVYYQKVAHLCKLLRHQTPQTSTHARSVVSCRHTIESSALSRNQPWLTSMHCPQTTVCTDSGTMCIWGANAHGNRCNIASFLAYTAPTDLLAMTSTSRILRARIGTSLSRSDSGNVGRGVWWGAYDQARARPVLSHGSTPARPRAGDM